MTRLHKQKRSAGVLGFGCALGLLAFLVASWMDGYDEFYIDSYQRDSPLFELAAGLVALIKHDIGAVWMTVAGGVLGIPLAVWICLSPKMRRAMVGLTILAGTGLAAFVWYAVSHPKPPPETTWVEPSRTEPEGSHFRTFLSKTIGGDVSYLIYLPQKYSESQASRYPVVYFLPGGRGKQTEIQYFLRRYNAVSQAGRAIPMIVVGVNRGTPYSGYRDPPLERAPIESLIMKDLVPHIDETYRTIRESRARGLYGGSLGGFGALHLGLKYPESFGVICSEAPNLIWWPGMDSPWGSAQTKAQAIKQAEMRIRVVCGMEDGLFRSVKAFHGLLLKMDITHSYLEVPGAGHGDLRQRLTDDEVVGFFAEAFKGLGE